MSIRVFIAWMIFIGKCFAAIGSVCEPVAAAWDELQVRRKEAKENRERREREAAQKESHPEEKVEDVLAEDVTHQYNKKTYS